MRKLQLVDDLDAPPIVGRMYLVRCVLWTDASPPRWMPLLGQEHEDADLGVPCPHRHYDLRFVQARDLGGCTPERYMHRLHVSKDGERIEIRRKRCVRVQPTFPFPPESAAIPRFERRHAAKVAEDCRRCPHRGFDLTQVPVDAGGGKVCPGHGLRWNVQTGELMRRTPRGPVRTLQLRVVNDASPYFWHDGDERSDKCRRLSFRWRSVHAG